MTLSRSVLIASLVLLPFLAAYAAPFTAFTDGETFTYKVSWGIFFHAGDIVISAHEGKDTNGANIFRITTDAVTRGFVSAVYSYHNRAEGIIDSQTGRLLFTREKGSDGTHFTDNETTFDYRREIAHYVDYAHPNRTQDVAIPPGDPVDLISALVETRNWNLKPGEQRDVLVNLGNEFFPITMHAEAYEEVHTPLGDYQTLILVPRMDRNPKGIFKRGGQIKVWISQTDQKLPVKMQLRLQFGAATLLLSRYQPGISHSLEKPAP